MLKFVNHQVHRNTDDYPGFVTSYVQENVCFILKDDRNWVCNIMGLLTVGSYLNDDGNRLT